MKKPLSMVLILIIILPFIPILIQLSAKPAYNMKADLDTVAFEAGEALSGDTKPPVVIRILTPDSMDWNHYPDNPVAEEIRKQTGVTIRFVEADTNKMRVLAADGDLPDIIMARQISDFQMRTILIESNNVIPLDDLLQTHGLDIIKNSPTMIEYSKKYWSCDRNKIYALSPQAGSEFIGIEPGIGPVMRWDYYKELGCPKIRNEDDILDVLAQMVNNHPRTENGKKTYGVGIFNDWGSWCYQFLSGPMHGYMGVYDIKNNMPIPYYTMADGPYWAGARFLYRANKMGIMDPDSLIMGYNDLEVKMTSGSICYTVENWTSQKFNAANAGSLKGYQVIPVEGSYEKYNSQSLTGWYDRPFMISRNCKYPEKAVELLNYFYSYDGIRTITSGVKGAQWDIVKGKPLLKKEVIDAYSKGGEEWNKLQISGKSQGIGNLCGLSGAGINPEDGTPLSLFTSDDAIARLVTPLQKDFAGYYGALYPGQVITNMVKAGKMFDSSTDYSSIIASAKVTEPSNISMIGGKLEQCFMQGVSKCVLAKTEDEFNTNRKKVIDDLNALGYERYFTWQKQAWIKAKKEVGVE